MILQMYKICLILKNSSFIHISKTSEIKEIMEYKINRQLERIANGEEVI